MSKKINENYNPNQNGKNTRDNANPKHIEKKPTPPPLGSHTKKWFDANVIKKIKW